MCQTVYIQLSNSSVAIVKQLTAVCFSKIYDFMTVTIISNYNKFIKHVTDVSKHVCYGGIMLSSLHW